MPPPQNVPPPLTVAIPTWQGARFLREAIASVLAQSFGELELLVVDDASSDDSLEIARSFDDPRLRCLRNPERLGLVGNWNRCLELARGSLVAIFHQDDRMAPGNLAAKVALLDAHPEVGFVYSEVRQIDAEGATLAGRWWAPTAPARPPVRPGRDFFAAALAGANPVCAPGVVLRRALALELGGFSAELPFTADWELWLRLALRAEVGYLDAPLVDYRRHETMETARFGGAAGLEAELAAKRRVLELDSARIEEPERLRVALFARVVEEAWQRAGAADAAGAAPAALALFELAATTHALGVREAGPGYSARTLVSLAREAPGALPPGPEVVAIVAAHNEADVIGAVVGELARQGVRIYLIDHRSTDDTVAVARRAAGSALLGVESFPPAGEADPGFVWRRILERKEELAAELDADWFVHHDADEFRESPWPGVGLRQAIGLVDRLGYNAIDFAVFNFWPQDDSFRPGDDPRTSLRGWLPGGNFDRVQIKCWKKPPGGRVDLAPVGGHDANFPGRRVFPIRFVLRHYPLRSREHARRKIERERLPRFAAEERARGWHVQYDDLPADPLPAPSDLRPWDADAARVALQIDHRELEAARAEAAALEQKVSERDRELATTVARLGTAESEVGRLHQAVVDRDVALAAERDARAAERDAFAAERAAHAAEQAAFATERQDLAARAAELEAQVADRSRALDETTAARDRALAALAAVLGSRSWRLTAPLRRAVEALRRRS